MRIHRIELTGFGPFLQTQVVDFDQFADDGVFLITGPTGSGKTSLLDGICYALYGSVPRFEDSPGIGSVRSDHCGVGDPTLVQLEFSTSAGRFRITRSPEYERPKMRGEGTTKQAAHVEFARVEADGTAPVISAKSAEVGELVASTVGLGVKQFLRVVMLAQGRFQRFLVASSAERLALLRAIFDTKRFLDYETEFEQRSVALRKQLEQAESLTFGSVQHFAQVVGVEFAGDAPGSSSATLSDIGPWLDAALVSVTQAVDAAEQYSKAAATELSGADAELLRLGAIAEAQQTKVRAGEQLAELEAVAQQIEVERARVKAGQRAAAVQSRVQDCLRRDAALDQARADQQTAIEAWTTRTNEAVPDDLGDTLTQLDGELGVLKQSAVVEDDLPRLTTRRNAAEGALKDFDARASRRRDERAELEERVESLTTKRDVGLARVAERGPADQAVHDLTESLDTARRAERVRAKAEQGLAVAQAAESELAEAKRKVTLLRTARLEGFAATLALELEPGQACPVCGAIDHPEPAQHDGIEVSVDEIEQAEAIETAAHVAATSAQTALSGLEAELSSLTERVGERSLDQLETELETARVTATQFDELAQQNARWAGEISQAKKDLGNLLATLAAADAERNQLVAAQSASEAELDQAQQRVSQARGEFDSVADRVTSVAERRSLVSTLVTSGQALISAQSWAESAHDALAEALTEHDFVDAAAAEAALVPAEELTTLTARIAAHDQQLVVVRSQLADPRLAELPAEPVDLEPAQQSRAAAAERAEAAASEAAAARKQAEIATAAATTARRHANEWATLEDQGGALLSLSLALRGMGSNTKRMRLESFVLAAELEEIMVAANRQLERMSGKQYRLEHSDSLAAHGAQSGLDLAVFDPDTGATRSPQSLSGGEQFLASLALALGLAEVVSARAGGLHLDTLFIDEGFGSLDPETLEAAMSTLDSLRTHGRTIGLISHVEAMKERITTGLNVEVTPAGTSRIT